MLFLAGNDPRNKLLIFRHYIMDHNVCAGTHTHRTSRVHYLVILSKDMFAYPYYLTFRSWLSVKMRTWPMIMWHFLL